MPERRDILKWKARSIVLIKGTQKLCGAGVSLSPLGLVPQSLLLDFSHGDSFPSYLDSLPAIHI